MSVPISHLSFPQFYSLQVPFCVGHTARMSTWLTLYLFWPHPPSSLCDLPTSPQGLLCLCSSWDQELGRQSRRPPTGHNKPPKALGGDASFTYCLREDLFWAHLHIPWESLGASSLQHSCMWALRYEMLKKKYYSVKEKSYLWHLLKHDMADFIQGDCHDRCNGKERLGSTLNTMKSENL